MLQKKWPNKRVTGLIADSAPVPRIYRFLPGSESWYRQQRMTGRQIYLLLSTSRLPHA
jgi:hypothetical protein